MKPLLPLLLVLAFAATAVAAPEKPRSVTIDVKNADVRDILRTVKQQCAIRNLIIDPDVKGTGTFLFRRVPCAQAIRTITESLGLGYEVQTAYVRVAAEP